MIRLGAGALAKGSAALAVVLGLALSSLVVVTLETALGIENGSPIYLVTVALVALRYGTWAAVVTAVAASLLYNLFAIDPRLSLAVARPQELLTLALLVFVGVVIGQLTGRQRERERAAVRREEEARALFGISRELVRSERLSDALDAVGGRLAEATSMARIWIGVGPTLAQERTISDTQPDEPPPRTDASHFVLRRDPSEGDARWTHIRPPMGRRASTSGGRLYRVELRAADAVVGSLWAERRDADGPRLEETRLLAATADQIGAAIRRDRLLSQGAELEIVRRSDELKSALVDSVSHDLRTPLAAIRAAAGSLADPGTALAEGERRSIALTIDAEAERLSRLVRDLLDLSRIRGGVLVPHLELFPIEELVVPAVERSSRSARAPIEVHVPPGLPPALVDGALMDRVLANLLDNALKYTPEDAPIRVAAAATTDGCITVTVEDGGPGVPDAALGAIFERFARAEDRPGGDRRGFGLGLAVVRGLVEAMSGSVRASRSELGGLAVAVTVPTAEAIP